MEPQLMITAGPTMGIPPQYAQNYAAAGQAPGYAPNMAYPGYGMQASLSFVNLCVKRTTN